MEEKQGRLGFLKDEEEVRRSEGSGAEEEAMIKGRPRLKEVDRNQQVLRPLDTEKLVEQEHRTRKIWWFVCRLDMSPFTMQIRAIEGVAGSSAYDPRVLLSLWLYALSMGISSAREIARMCEYDPGAMWITALEKIGHHTLSSFRVQHESVLRELFEQVLGVMSAEGMITLEQVTQDGTKVKACASNKSFRREKSIREHLALAREHLRQVQDPRYLEQIGERLTRAQQRAAKEELDHLEAALHELEKVREHKTQEEKAKVRVSETDPESRIMKQGGTGGYAPSYNLQLTADVKNDIIVGLAVSQQSADYQELIPAVDRIEETLGRKPGQVIADGGYTDYSNILAMHARGVDFIGSIEDEEAQREVQLRRAKVDEAFFPSAFTYDEVSDTYCCPAGQLLVSDGKETLKGRTRYRYRTRSGVCQQCEMKNKCCPTNELRGRSITRMVRDKAVQGFFDKMMTPEAKSTYKLRAQVAEFPNAWLKEKIGLRQFRLRGLKKVLAESYWACITYNLMQYLRLTAN